MVFDLKSFLLRLLDAIKLFYDVLALIFGLSYVSVLHAFFPSLSKARQELQLLQVPLPALSARTSPCKLEGILYSILRSLLLFLLDF